MPTQTQQKKLTKQQIQGILDNTPKHIATEDIINGLVGRGFILEGLNDQPTTQEKNLSAVKDRFQDTKSAWNKSMETTADPNSSLLDVGKEALRAGVKTVGNIAGGIGDVIGNEVTGIDKAVTGGKVTDTISKVVQPIAEPVMEQVDKYVPEGTLARDTLNATANVVGLTGAGFATKGLGKAVKSASPIVKEGVESVVNKVANSKVATKAGEKISSVTDNFTDPVKALENSYNEIFNTSGVQAKKRLNKSLEKDYNPSKFLAEKNLVLDIEEGKFNVNKTKAKILEDARAVDELLTEGLASVNAKVNLEDLRQKALSKIDTLDNKKNNSYYEMVNIINKEIDSYKKSFGEEVDVPTLNELKRGQWENSGFDTTKSNQTRSSHKALGNAFKEEIESVAKANGIDGVAELNKYLGEHFDTIDIIQKFDGKPVKGGRLGNAVFSTAGAMMGLGSGGMLNTLGGFVAGGTMSRIAQQMQVSNPIRNVLLKRLEMESPEIVNKFKKQLNYFQNQVPKNPNIPAPSTTNINDSISPIISRNTKNTKAFENPLIQEAKKYKSAEEFIKAQGTPFYHGTNADFNEFDIKKIGTQTDDGMFGKGFYFTPNEKMAEQAPFGAKAKFIKEVNLYIKNPLEINNFKTIEDLAYHLNMSESAFVKDGSGMIRPLNSQINQFTSKVKDAGYDGVYVRRNGVGDEIVVFNPEQIKTKSQLEQIWKEANNK